MVMGASGEVFTLTPHTAVEFLGDAQVNVAMDVTGIQATLVGLPNNARSRAVSAQAYFEGYVYFGDSYNHPKTGYAFSMPYKDLAYSFDDSGAHLAPAPYTSSDIQSISMTVANESDIVDQGKLDWQISVSTALSLNGPIPEPGTMVLQALGMLALVAVRKARH